MVTESSGVIRVARQVLLTIIINVALETPGVIRMAEGSEQWSRFLGREVPRQGVALTIKDNVVSADLYIVVASGVHIVEVGSVIQAEVASAIEEMVNASAGSKRLYS